MPYKFDNASILLVDDMMPMLSITRSVVSVFGFKNIHAATNGEEAFDIARREDPDLIITDWHMAPMDGIELTRKIRNDDSSSNKFVPIIMMSGFASIPRVEEARDAGITEFLAKPYTAHDLYLRIAQTIEKPRQFVAVDDFFGPDRRRRKVTGETHRRREDDIPIDQKSENILKTLRQEAEKLAKHDELRGKS